MHVHKLDIAACAWDTHAYVASLYAYCIVTSNERLPPGFGFYLALRIASFSRRLDDYNINY